MASTTRIWLTIQTKFYIIIPFASSVATLCLCFAVDPEPTLWRQENSTWTECQSIKGPHTHKHTYLKGKLAKPSQVFTCFWTVQGNQRIQTKPMWVQGRVARCTTMLPALPSLLMNYSHSLLIHIWFVFMIKGVLELVWPKGQQALSKMVQ